MRRVRKGWLHRVHHGVYAVGYAPQTLDAHFMAAVVAGGDEAWLSHWSSCALADLVRWDGRLIEVTVRGSGARAREGIRFHRACSLDQRDTTRIHGIPCKPNSKRPACACCASRASRPGPCARGA